jgi:hypothetical protein
MTKTLHRVIFSKLNATNETKSSILLTTVLMVEGMRESASKKARLRLPFGTFCYSTIILCSRLIVRYCTSDGRCRTGLFDVTNGIP